MLKLLLTLAALFVYVQGDFETTRQLVIEKGLDPKLLTTIEGRVYFFGSNKEGFDDATTICNDLRMVLVSLETEHKEQLIVNYVRDNDLLKWPFFATSGTILYDRWFWSGSGQTYTYTNWRPNTPNLPGRPVCMYIYVSLDQFHWEDELCSVNNFNFICEQAASYCP